MSGATEERSELAESGESSLPRAKRTARTVSATQLTGVEPAVERLPAEVIPTALGAHLDVVTRELVA